MPGSLIESQRHEKMQTFQPRIVRQLLFMRFQPDNISAINEICTRQINTK